MKTTPNLVKALLVSLSISLLIVSATGCKGGKKESATDDTTAAQPNEALNLFNADSAYSYIAQQVAFGTRVPNTPTHQECGEWIAGKLKGFGLEVVLQQANVSTHESVSLPITNIIGRLNPSAERRILLLAHWDTRPTADNDPNPSRKSEPILGADDAASGVGVLLEVARQLADHNSTLGVDFLFVDAEDMGVSENEDSWCLGSTYWSKHPHVEHYRAEFGILLDMVGAHNAKFRWEYFSKTHAPSIVSSLWDKAASLGYGHYFIQADGAALTDDHKPIIDNLAIPTIDIVNYDPARSNGFGAHWHTHGDNMEVIDKEVLKAVGETLMAYLEERENERK
ncbi:M28 family peptidase [Porphyromonas endodontalis]